MVFVGALVSSGQSDSVPSAHGFQGSGVLRNPFPEFAETYCLDCHNAEDKKGKFDMEAMLSADPVAEFESWESVLWALQDRDMPPDDEPGVALPPDSEYAAMLHWMEPWFSDLEAGYAGPAELGSTTALVETYCISCHNEDDAVGELVLEGLNLDDPGAHPEILEKMVHRMHARQMPPAEERRRPADDVYAEFTHALSTVLDELAEKKPQPGRIDSFRRLNRTEYQNAIRDLLAVDIDTSVLLPADELAHGFDNITVTSLSPTLMDRYITAAQKISRLAVGAPLKVPAGYTVRIPGDRTQEKHVAGLPLGTRGGALIPYHFPREGEYEIRMRLTRDRNEHVEGLQGEHQIELLLEDQLLQSYTIKRPDDGRKDHVNVDRHLVYRGDFKAGPQNIGVTFPEKIAPLMETRRRPFEARFNYHRHPRQNPALYQVTITGPFESGGAGQTPSRDRIFTTTPEQAGGEREAAREILSKLMRLAYRRPVTAEDLTKPMAFYAEGAQEGGFEAGIELALSAVLVSPEFLFRIEREPEAAKSGEAYAISQLELASRLSFFVWSSIPDDELLSLAEAGRLREPGVIDEQIERMLADPRSANLSTNFAGQWLHLRNLENTAPNLRLFPDFDDNLRQSFKRETELFIDSIVREDRSAVDLLSADYTYLNERLARHYGIPSVRGSRFRRVELDPAWKRGGLLRQGSVLTVTSYATRTSPVIRGNWILENILGTPPPPPPADVPSLDTVILEKLPMRERLALHRADPACASCHNLMDPPGFALENFDAVGRWRDSEDGLAINAEGGLPDGQSFHGADGLEYGLLVRPDLFVATLTEKLMIFALGRGVEYYDAPAIRKIVRESADDNYRISVIVAGIARSVPFQMRTAL
ncbi:MAG: hypothetical protein SynsKO_13260 [Synoicihabitans sp.]